jgi:tripeptidyl-peptidase I
LALRGVTITVSSGDDGAISSAARHNPMFCSYAPSFPASSPYVVAVGGTMVCICDERGYLVYFWVIFFGVFWCLLSVVFCVNQGPESGHEEIACQADLGGIITSGGGFSTIFTRPDWQNDAVNSYLNRTHGTVQAPSPGFGSGRGFPDVSLLAREYVVALGGNFTAVSGTSASSPVFAGMISLVNTARLREGKPALGWVTPALYKLSSSFVKDVTSGHNKCVASASVCCQQGFHATEGWDPVTGLGSVDFVRFQRAMLSIGDPLPPGSPTPTPTLSPVPVPTILPTASPTTASGWMYIHEYNQESCTGKITTISGLPTNRCLTEYSGSEQTIVGSRILSCKECSSPVLSNVCYV